MLKQLACINCDARYGESCRALPHGQQNLYEQPFAQGENMLCGVSLVCPLLQSRPEVDVIDNFTGRYAFLSNFYAAPTEFEGVKYLNAEAAFQSAKTLNETERQQFTQISASSAKYLGRRVPLRSDWKQVKDDVMYAVVLSKFMLNPILGIMLVATSDARLIEGNTWGDTYWGVCDGKGKNKLGEILMRVRRVLSLNI